MSEPMAWSLGDLPAPEVRRVEQACRRFERAWQEWRAGPRPDLGEALLKKKIDNNPTQGPYVLQLALHYYWTNRKPEMTATLARLTSNLKTYPDGRLQAGDFYLRLRDLDNALQQYDLGQKEDTKNKRTYQKRMVEVLGTEGKHDQAAKIVDALLKQDPKIARLLDPDTIDGLFDTAYHLKHVDTIFRRVFGE